MYLQSQNPKILNFLNLEKLTQSAVRSPPKILEEGATPERQYAQ